MLRDIENLLPERRRLNRPLGATITPFPGKCPVWVNEGDEACFLYAGEVRTVKVVRVGPLGLLCRDRHNNDWKTFSFSRIGRPATDAAGEG